jgi:hypothetical protein
VKIGCLKLLKRTNLKTNSNAASGFQNPGFGAAGNPKTFVKQQPVLRFDVGFFRRASRNSPFHLEKLKGNSKQPTIHK